MKKKPPAKGETPTPKPTKRPTAGGDFSEELFLRDWKNRTPTELWRYANHALQCLRLLAMNGDAEATSVHLKVVVNAVYGLCEEMKRPNLGGLGAAIQSSPTWPAFFPANRKSRELLAKRMADLGLATNYCTDALGNYHAESPATRCVLSIFQMLLDSGKVRDGNAGNLMFFNGVPVTAEQKKRWREWVKTEAPKLPARLVKDNARDWANITEAVLKIFWGEKFETHPHFSEYQRSAPADKIRGEIMRMWRQSWRSIAKPN